MAVNQRHGRYKLPECMRATQDIRKLIIEGCKYDAIMQLLHLTPRTFYRYLSAVFEDDKTSVGSKNISDEEVLSNGYRQGQAVKAASRRNGKNSE